MVHAAFFHLSVSGNGLKQMCEVNELVEEEHTHQHHRSAERERGTCRDCFLTAILIFSTNRSVAVIVAETFQFSDPRQFIFKPVTSRPHSAAEQDEEENPIQENKFIKSNIQFQV